MKKYVYTNEAYRNLEPASGGCFDLVPPNVEGYDWTVHSWCPSPVSGVLLIVWEGRPLEQDELDPDLPIPYEIPPTTPAPAAFDLVSDPDDDDEPECDCPGCEHGTGCVARRAASRIRTALGLGRQPQDLITADDTQAFVDQFRKDGKGNGTDETQE